MKILKYILSTIMIAACVSGCIKYDEVDYDIDSPDLGMDDGSSISFKIPTMESVVSTRAEGMGEYTINNGYLFVFNSESECTGYITLTGDDISWGTDDAANTFTVSIGELSYVAGDNIVSVFNYDSSKTPEIPTEASDVKLGDINTYFPLDAAYLATVTTAFNEGEYSTYGMPMAVNDFEYGTSSGYHEVYRALARLEVFVLDDVDDNITTGGETMYSQTEHSSNDFSSNNVTYAIVNDIQSGMISEGTDTREEETIYTAPANVDIPENFFKYSLTAVSSSDTSTVDEESGTNRVYLYPYNYSTTFINGDTASSTDYSSDRFAILLEHTIAVDNIEYYKLNLFDKLNNNKYFDIERNHDYRIIITEVHSNGYDTLEEAYLAPPSNIDYEIYDDQGNATLSNGQYAISMDEVVTYSQLDIYGDGDVEVRFDNISYVIPTQMSNFNMDDLTNTVTVSYTMTDDLAVSVVNPFGDGTGSGYTYSATGVLTPTPQDVVFTISGEGSCTIGLHIQLGNLEAGVEEITVNRYGVGGDGALDAHPAQLRYEDREYVEGSWSSTSTDFGARSSNSSYTTDSEIGYDDGTVVLYMGHNATPVGYKTMDDAYTSFSSEDSYPIFEDKDRSGSYTYINESGEAITTKVMVTQLKPYYLGHFGNTATSGVHHYNALISERIEEIEGGYAIDDTNTPISDYPYNGDMSWHVDSWVTAIYSSIYDLSTERYLNLVEGNTISKYIVNSDVSKKALAVQYCYMKNDINGNGVIEDDEEIEWHLPAQNQLLAMWISKYQYDSATVDSHMLAVGTGYDNPYYWSCSESINSETVDSGSSFTDVRVINMLEGDGTSQSKSNWASAHIRCVRGVTYSE